MCLSCFVHVLCCGGALCVFVLHGVCVGHGGAACRRPAARGTAEADCGLYTGKQPSKIQNKQHKAQWM